MLNSKLINPQIVGALALCGHGDKVLISDGNYPLASKTGNAEKVYLGLTPGQPSVTDVLEAVLSAVNVEKAELMSPEDGTEPPVFEQFHQILEGAEFEVHERQDFYKSCCQENVRLAISTGEGRLYSNILITIGVA